MGFPRRWGGGRGVGGCICVRVGVFSVLGGGGGKGGTSILRACAGCVHVYVYLRATEFACRHAKIYVFACVLTKVHVCECICKGACLRVYLCACVVHVPM